jgi:hypothetical protein
MLYEFLDLMSLIFGDAGSVANFTDTLSFVATPRKQANVQQFLVMTIAILQMDIYISSHSLYFNLSFP